MWDGGVGKIRTELCLRNGEVQQQVLLKNDISFIRERARGKEEEEEEADKEEEKEEEEEEGDG